MITLTNNIKFEKKYMFNYNKHNTLLHRSNTVRLLRATFAGKFE